jgi:DNA-binding NarL/FixJ family response regulator
VIPLSAECDYDALLSTLGMSDPLACASADHDLARTLTPKEKRVVQMIINGKTHKEVSKTLRVTTSTVQSYKERAMEKLGVEHLTDLAVHGAASGLRSCPCKNRKEAKNFDTESTES